jgi:hypothetical protein
MMNYERYASFWWASVTGPHRLRVDVMDALSSNRPTILFAPENLSWKEIMFSSVEENLRKYLEWTDISVVVVDGDRARKPGDFLLEKYQTDYHGHFRQGSGKIVQEFLVSSGVLRNKFFEVSCPDSESATAWIDFLKELKPPAEHKTFALVTTSCRSFPVSQKRVAAFDCEKIISPRDVQTLCSYYLAEESKLSDSLQDYLSALASAICLSDAENALRLIYNLSSDALSQEPPEVWNGKGTAQEIWKAQLAGTFSQLELLRRKYIASRESDIGNALASQEFRQFNEIIRDPFDLELGALDYMARHCYFSTKQDEREKLSFLRECRNNLAHGNHLTSAELKRVFELDLVHE